MPLYIHFSFTRKIFHLLLVTKVPLFEKSSVRRENLGTRFLSGSSIGLFHYLFVRSKITFFSPINLDISRKRRSRFRSSTRETRNECAESSALIETGHQKKQIRRRRTQPVIVMSYLVNMSSDLSW